MSDPFPCWYSLADVAARLGVSRRTVLRAVEADAGLRGSARRMFGEVFLPWPALSGWLEARPGFEARPVGGRVVGGRFLRGPTRARSEGELRRRLEGAA